jgi:UDP-2,3-diacylglucosamine hydrolase
MTELPAQAQRQWRTQWCLPASVQRVEWVSDVHVCADRPHTATAFTRYLAHTRADVVCVLGDLFEAWIGDDALSVLPFERDIVTALAHVSQRAQLGVMCGNRDFLLSSGFLSACGAVGLADPCRVEAFGQSVLATHGDALCVADRAYQQVRQVVRSGPWQANFLARSVPERLAIAQQLRAQSQAEQADLAPEDYADVDAATATVWLHDAGCSRLIHGHTHRPTSSDWREVLSDWDLEPPGPARASVLRWTAQGFSRHTLDEFSPV